MIVENPEVTLEVEGYQFPEGAPETAMYLWDHCLSAYGDDGKQYWIDSAIGSHRSQGTFAGVPFGAIDMWSMGVSWEKGKVVQSPGSVYKIADFPQVSAIGWHPYPGGDLTVKRSEHEVAVDLHDFHLVCKDGKTWHYSVEDKEKGIKAEWVHTGIGYPTWYGKEKPQVYTPHTVAYGYFWSGTIEGMLTIEGREVRIKGKGVRERYYAMDNCSAEVGGWHDWIWFHFDEMFGSFNEMKFSKHKDMSLYLIDEKEFLPVGSFNIEHSDWAYLRPLGAFIPTRYTAAMETEAGVLEMTTNVVGCQSWGVTGEVPDCPTTILHWDKLDGTFTYKDGRKRTLNNGLGGTLIRQWKPYPNILEWFIPEIAGADVPKVVHLPTIE